MAKVRVSRVFVFLAMFFAANSSVRTMDRQGVQGDPFDATINRLEEQRRLADCIRPLVCGVSFCSSMIAALATGQLGFTFLGLGVAASAELQCRPCLAHCCVGGELLRETHSYLAELDRVEPESITQEEFRQRVEQLNKLQELIARTQELVLIPWKQHPYKSARERCLCMQNFLRMSRLESYAEMA